MSRLTDKQLIDQLLKKFSPRVAKAFSDAVASIRDDVTLKVVVDRLERGDINGALDALHIDKEAFSPIELAITDAYNNMGIIYVDNLPRVPDPNGGAVVFRFGVRNTAGEAELRNSLDRLSTDLATEARTVARTTLENGLRAGTNPTQTALDLIGRVNRSTGRREGGLIGLSEPQATYVATARDELLSGDPAALNNYLSRGRRDKRFDATVRKAIKDKKPLPKETVNRIVGRYSSGLLKLRGDMISLNEVMAAMAKAKHDAMRQQIDAGRVDQKFVTKVWHHTAEQHPRLNHLALDGKSIGFNDRFNMGDGITMRYAHDPEGGPGETVFCRCRTEYRFAAIDALVAGTGS